MSDDVSSWWSALVVRARAEETTEAYLAWQERQELLCRLEALTKELDEREDYELCDTCGNLSTETADDDGEGNPLGHVQCAQCSRIAELEYQRSTAREHLQRERDRADSEAQRAEAYKLRIATLDESIAGCARKVQAVAAERDALKVALEVIAKQALAADMPAIGVDPTEADYEAGYIGCVETARNALAVAEPEVNSKSRLKRLAVQRGEVVGFDLASSPDRTVYRCQR